LASVCLRDAVVVQVAVGLHAEELRGQVLTVLGVPAGHADKRRIFGEAPRGCLSSPTAMPMS
jgi:hypothetical protein